MVLVNSCKSTSTWPNTVQQYLIGKCVAGLNKDQGSIKLNVLHPTAVSSYLQFCF
jgi:hypothetical protein